MSEQETRLYVWQCPVCGVQLETASPAPLYCYGWPDGTHHEATEVERIPVVPRVERERTVEAVARGLFDAWCEGCAAERGRDDLSRWDEIPMDTKDAWRASARSALEALREETK